MNSRTIRRAAERKAQKQANKEAAKAHTAAPGSFAEYVNQEHQNQDQDFIARNNGPAWLLAAEKTAPVAATISSTPYRLTEVRQTANRENAKLSTGPKTVAGKLVSSKNALKTALTGRTVLLPTDDADRYQSHIQAFNEEIQPAGHRETLLTQSLADIAWRLERIAAFEMAIYARGRAQFANTHQDEPEALRPHLIELDIYEANERGLRNLHLQEARLRRQRDRDNEELRRLQGERKQIERQKQEAAAKAPKKAERPPKSADSAPNGFVFSSDTNDPLIEALPALTAPNSRKEAA